MCGGECLEGSRRPLDLTSLHRQPKLRGPLITSDNHREGFLDTRAPFRNFSTIADGDDGPVDPITVLRDLASSRDFVSDVSRDGCVSTLSVKRRRN